MKRVLVITYYWPPSGGAGVQRWLKFVKYLRNFGWEPVIFTPVNPEFPEIDNSLLHDIPAGTETIKNPIWEPYNFYKKFTGKSRETKISAGFLTEEKKPAFTDQVSVWIRGNLFIPDARKFWINPSIKYLSHYLKNHSVEAIVSTGPPHSCHLIAAGIKEKSGLPWLADFRDPWTGIDFYEDLKLSAYADAKHRKLEQKVLHLADAVCVISRGMEEEFNRIFPRKYEVITNGFDAADYAGTGAVTLDKTFSISHIGSLVPSRNPVVLWKALSEMISEGHPIQEHLEIKLVGKVDYSVISETEKLGLKPFITKIDYLSHDEVVHVQKQSQVLLLLINNTPNAKSILTGKFFEYLAASRPVLCIGPEDGDAAKILEDSQAGTCVGYENTARLKATVGRYYEDFLNNNLTINPQRISQYSREYLTGKLAGVLDNIVSSKR